MSKHSILLQLEILLRLHSRQPEGFVYWQLLLLKQKHGRIKFQGANPQTNDKASRGPKPSQPSQPCQLSQPSPWTQATLSACEGLALASACPNLWCLFHRDQETPLMKEIHPQLEYVALFNPSSIILGHVYIFLFYYVLPICRYLISFNNVK